MGNGSSQSVVLGHSNRPLGQNLYTNRYERAPNYAHPHNRVLPKPVAGQRLRSTDNGHILQSAGTIRGLKTASPSPVLQNHEDGDPEVMDALKRRSQMIEKERQDFQMNLHNHRMFYSDPDISRSRGTSSSYSPEALETSATRRISGGAAAKANKLKQKKKARAPDPPPLGDNFHGQFQRRSQSSLDIRDQRNAECRCLNGSAEWKPKNRAPQPPPLVNPPIPPPFPNTNRTPFTKNQCNSANSSNTRLSSPIRAIPCSPRIANFDRNCQVQKAGLSKSVGDLRYKEETDSRTIIFNSKEDLSNRQPKKPALLPNLHDPFQKEIEAVTKKIAQTYQRDTVSLTEETSGQNQQKKNNPPKPYYFCDKDVFRIDFKSSNQNTQSPTKIAARNSDIKPLNEIPVSGDGRLQEKSVSPSRVPLKIPEDISIKEESPLRRFSPVRRHVQTSSSGSSLQDSSKKSGRNQDATHHALYNGNTKCDIDVRLRPVLPRKPLDVPKFSPAEAWQALGSDGQGSSNQSTSDESIPRYIANRFIARAESRRLSDITNNKSYGHPSYNFRPSESHWTPRQDLGDSDTSSVGSEEAVVPKHQIGEFSTRFSLPTVMFSNMRPIGTDPPPGKRLANISSAYYNGDSRMFKQHKKKVSRDNEASGDLNGASHFRKFLGMRNKYLSEEDISVSDSNWTFGGYGLPPQKREKQYSSDLMLSDKKKYEVMMKNNFGEFLSDILVTEANAMKNQMKSSDSGNSNFSFYSTEGHLMYLPEAERRKKFLEPKSKNINDHRKFIKTDQAFPSSKNYKKLSHSADIERNRSYEIVRMLEDEVRRKRNKEKILIRQQLRMMKQFNSDDDGTEEEVDEAYFTEPKSLEGSSPLHLPLNELHYQKDGIPKYDRKLPVERVPCQSTPLTHWTSSPALLNEPSTQTFNGSKGFHSSSSVTSSPDPVAWDQPSVSDKRPPRKQQSQSRRSIGKQRRVSEGDSSPALDRRSCDKVPSAAKEHKKLSKDKRATTSIYKQLMDIVRREERHLKKAEGNEFDPASRESSYSQRESSHSSSSHNSVSSSSNSYSDCSGPPTQEDSGKSGVPANNEFHSATSFDIHRVNQEERYNSRQAKPAQFHSAFVQPFTPNKSYRPVPFEVPVPSATSCRMPALHESHKADVSQMCITTE